MPTGPGQDPKLDRAETVPAESAVELDETEYVILIDFPGQTANSGSHKPTSYRQDHLFYDLLAPPHYQFIQVPGHAVSPDYWRVNQRKRPRPQYAMHFAEVIFNDLEVRDMLENMRGDTEITSSIGNRDDWFL
jgi:hypothetical protein